MSQRDKDHTYFPIVLFGIVVAAFNIYWNGFRFFYELGLHHEASDAVLLKLDGAPVVSHPIMVKALAVLLFFVACIIRNGKPTNKSWGSILVLTATGLFFFFFPWSDSMIFVLASLLGLVCTVAGFSLIGRKIGNMQGLDRLNDPYETFLQCDRKMVNNDSINIPTVYKYKGRRHHGWVNIINPFRATMVLGTPGSGKSFSVFNPFIEQSMAKGYTAYLYDFKFPTLTEEIYNEYLLNLPHYKRMYGKAPKFCVINFDDPRYSMRSNPINPRYLTDPADTAEIADIIWNSVKPDKDTKEDFFSQSAKVYIDALIWFLKIFENGRYCTFPHLIELLCHDYRLIFEILDKYAEGPNGDPSLSNKMKPFEGAMRDKAMEQLAGQIASAQIPLLRFSSPALYWVMSGNDFTLDLNNPDDPKIICVGNNPDRKSIYGTTMALYNARMFRIINHKENADQKRNLKSMVFLDEFPTSFNKDIDFVIATARSNKVAMVLGAQDKSQITRDYGEKESEVIYNTIGNIIAGQVNGRTAKSLSEMFGKEYRVQDSQTFGGENTTTNRSFHQFELMPQSRIETLSQGFFCGKLADNNDQKMERKLFCSEIKIDLRERARKEKNRKRLPQFDSKWFNDEAVKERIMADPERYMYDYILAQVRQEEMGKYYEDNTYTTITEGSVLEDEEVMRRLDEATKTDRRKFLAKIIKEEQDKAVYEVVRRNYDHIRADVMDIFRKEGIDTDGGAAETDDDGTDEETRREFDEGAKAAVSIDNVDSAGNVVDGMFGGQGAKPEEKRFISTEETGDEVQQLPRVDVNDPAFDEAPEKAGTGDDLPM